MGKSTRRIRGGVRVALSGCCQQVIDTQQALAMQCLSEDETPKQRVIYVARPLFTPDVFKSVSHQNFMMPTECRARTFADPEKMMTVVFRSSHSTLTLLSDVGLTRFIACAATRCTLYHSMRVTADATQICDTT
jgi:hypothetical protein